MANDGNRISPPFSPPDIEWVEMSPGKAVPENAFNVGGKLNGDPIYMGRVYDDGCYLVGTAVPNKGCCFYLNKKGEVKSTTSYEIVTVWIPHRLVFENMALDDQFLCYVAGGTEDDGLYAARVQDGENTYIGWAEKETKTVHVPRDPASGPGKVKENYDVVMHTRNMADWVQVCPGGPPSDCSPPAI